MDKLQFEPVDIAGLWSLQGNRRTPLADLVGALFTRGAQPGAPLQSDGLCLLPLWPHQAYGGGQRIRTAADRHRARPEPVSAAR